MQENGDLSIEDLLTDDTFVDWVLHPTDKTESYWTKWLQEHPTKQDLVQRAIQTIENLHTADTPTLATDLIETTWKAIDTQIETTKVVPFYQKWSYRAMAVAAVLLIGLMAAFQLFQPLHTNTTTTITAVEWVEVHNTTGQAQDIVLDDGSLVILEPYSLLKYPTTFSGKQREVILSGEAFFDIERDTTQPFLVYANETITKVLGTSFRILAFEGNDDVEVSVTTGKVAVYAKVKSEQRQAQKPKHLIVQADEKILLPLPNKKLEITPNQKVVFNKTEKKIIKSVKEKPNLVLPVEKITKFEFEEAPISEIFEGLSEAYGLEMIYNKTDLKECTLTTQLMDFPLFEKLKIICFALDLDFEEKNGRIYITGEGCS